MHFGGLAENLVGVSNKVKSTYHYRCGLGVHQYRPNHLVLLDISVRSSPNIKKTSVPRCQASFLWIDVEQNQMS